MSIWVVMGAGPSLTPADVDYVKDMCMSGHDIKVCVVNNAFILAPWADVLVAADPAWWNHYKSAHAFKGDKLCPKTCAGITAWKPSEYRFGQNSGKYGMHVAVDRKASKIILLGFDMHSTGKTHFFGEHPKPLSNPNALIFNRHVEEFKLWSYDTPVVNCTPNSALTRFPMGKLEDELNAGIRSSYTK